MLGESIHSLTLLLFCPPSPPVTIVLYWTLTGKLSIREGSQSGELAIIRVYWTVRPVLSGHGVGCPSATHRGWRFSGHRGSTDRRTAARARPTRMMCWNETPTNHTVFLSVQRNGFSTRMRKRTLTARCPNLEPWRLFPFHTMSCMIIKWYKLMI